MRIITFIISLLLISLFPVGAQASDKAFFGGIAGKWSGPGEIVAGKYKGTKFVCLFDGNSLARQTGMDIDGSCRVGLFSQKMNANVKRKGRGYRGQFLDGAAGEGMDVIGGRLQGNKIVMNIKRKDLNGVMVAKLVGNKKLNITISVRVNKQLIPVIGMSLDRMAGATRTSSVN